MTVEYAPQIVHYPLANARGEVLFKVRTDAAEDGDHDYREDREVENRKLVGADVTDN